MLKVCLLIWYKKDLTTFDVFSTAYQVNGCLNASVINAVLL